MEILLAVVSTILILGLGLSLFLHIITLGSIQQKNNKLSDLSAKQDVILHNQQQLGQLLSSMTFSINGLALTMEDIMALSEGYGFPTDLENSSQNPQMSDFSELEHNSDFFKPSDSNPELTDDEIKFLRNLLRKDEESNTDD